MHIGIDLGTTFSCVAYIDEDGHARMIPNADGEETTPSVIWFDGQKAWVGKKANIRKTVDGQEQNVYEFIKRDIGRPVEIPPNFFQDDDRRVHLVAPYEIGGFKYGAAGMSALILRKLKKDAIKHFQRLGRLDHGLDERSIELDAVITVPAYFGDIERQETKLAGYAAGLNVIGMINEPTAAAVSYGLRRTKDQIIMVFDLGGGTFDVTILRMDGGEAEVLATGGHSQLGGKDWDELIQAHIRDTFRVRVGRDLPISPQRIFEVQQSALQAKFDLSEAEQTLVSLSVEEGELNETLYRSASAMPLVVDDDELQPFFFEERSTELLQVCRAICEEALLKVVLTTAGGRQRSMEWSDLGEILLAGGACRMPMIPAMLQQASGSSVKGGVAGFDYDTAVAIGAALYGQYKEKVRDVLSHSIGIKLQVDDRFKIDHILPKHLGLPACVERVYPAGANAVLEVYQGESENPDEAVKRGRIELDNPEGPVRIAIEADENGMLKVLVDYPPRGQKTAELKNELHHYDQRALALRDKVQSIHINT